MKVIYTSKNNKKVKCKKELKFLLFIMRNSSRSFGITYELYKVPSIYFPCLEKSNSAKLLLLHFTEERK